ncbi:MAG: FxsA family protein [Acidimicrobiales bacterium]|nr:FxsA family protein [Acidimicrobiales bacterium]
MGLVLFLLLIVAPLLELYVIIQVAQVIGGWETIALLVIESAIGAWLLKRQGLSVIRRVAEAVDQGRVPGKEMVDGLLLLVAGALMLAPGFLGDVIGYLLLLPPTRAVIRAPLMRRFDKGGFGRFGSMFAGAAGPAGSTFVGSFRVRSTGDIIDVSGRDHRDRPSIEP